MTPRAPGRTLGQAAEAAVVALARAGDDAAFAELVVRRQAWLRQLLRRLCRDGALADDLAQQSLLQAWQRLPGLRDCAAFGAWLQRLAVNLWLQQLRRAAKLAGHASLEDAAGASEPDDPARAAGLGERLGERLDLEAALGRLTPLCRLCIVLAYVEGMSHTDISHVTGLALGTVKSHVRRGGAQLRSWLADYAPEETGA